MSGVGFNELIVLFIIGLLILGPERLPRVATQIGRWVGRARRTANQLRYQLEREIALADIEKKSDEMKRWDTAAVARKKPEPPAAVPSGTATFLPASSEALSLSISRSARTTQLSLSE